MFSFSNKWSTTNTAEKKVPQLKWNFLPENTNNPPLNNNNNNHSLNNNIQEGVYSASKALARHMRICERLLEQTFRDLKVCFECSVLFAAVCSQLLMFFS